MTEHEVKKEIMAYLTVKQIYHWRNNTGMGRKYVYFGLKGSADILGILPDGRFLAIECKSATGKQSPEQIVFQDNVNANNGLYILARSVDDIKRELPEGGNR